MKLEMHANYNLFQSLCAVPSNELTLYTDRTRWGSTLAKFEVKVQISLPVKHCGKIRVKIRVNIGQIKVKIQAKIY